MSGHEDLSLSHLTHVRPWPEVSRMKMSSEDDKKDFWADGHLGGLPRSCFSVSAIYWSSKKKWQRSATSSCPKWWNCESLYLRSLNSSRKRSDSKKRQSIPSVRSALPRRAQWRDTTSRGTFCPSQCPFPSHSSLKLTCIAQTKHPLFCLVFLVCFYTNCCTWIPRLNILWEVTEAGHYLQFWLKKVSPVQARVSCV